MSRIEQIMSAILRTRGPICSYHALTQSGPVSLRSISKQEYNVATDMLENEKLGIEVDVSTGPMGRYRSTLFVKKAPPLAEPFLCQLAHLCTTFEYHLRYQCKVPVKIKQQLRQQLIQKGYVTEEQMRY